MADEQTPAAEQKPAGEQAPAGTQTEQAPAAQTQTPAATEAPAADAAELARLRTELEELRTTSASAADTAAQTARDEMTQQFGKLLGLVEDETQTPDADALAQQIASEQASARMAKVELAVVRSAGNAGGDADALLDSTKFTKAIGKLDPAADDFADRVKAAIVAAVAENPKLASAPVVPARSGGDTSQGDGEGTGQLTRDQLAKLSPKERMAAHKAGRTKTLLG